MVKYYRVIYEKDGHRIASSWDEDEMLAHILWSNGIEYFECDWVIVEEMDSWTGEIKEQARKKSRWREKKDWSKAMETGYMLEYESRGKYLPEEAWREYK